MVIFLSLSYCFDRGLTILRVTAKPLQSYMQKKFFKRTRQKAWAASRSSQLLYIFRPAARVEYLSSFKLKNKSVLSDSFESCELSAPLLFLIAHIHRHTSPTWTSKSQMAAPLINSSQFISAYCLICISLNQSYTQHCPNSILGHVVLRFFFIYKIPCNVLISTGIANN